MPTKKITGSMKATAKKEKKKESGKTKKKKIGLGITLPTMKTKPETDIRKYTFMLYGREGVGKTTWLASFPKTLFITAEAGTKGLEVFEWNHEGGGTTSWEIFLAAKDAILADEGEHFRNMAIDTVERLWGYCEDYVCRELGISAMGETTDGKSDYGKSYRHVAEEFVDAIDEIRRAGVGMFLVSHVKEMTVRTRSGSEYIRMGPSLSDKPKRTIEAYSDFIFFADYAKDSEGRERRILVTSGDEIVTAKSRKIAGHTLPKYLELTEDGGYDYLKAAFRGEHEGLNPKTLMPSQRSTKAGGEMILEDRVNAKAKGKKIGRR